MRVRVRVTDVNFTTDKEWIFKFIDLEGIEYQAMDSEFYCINKLTNPITRMSLDHLNVGMWVNIDSGKVEGLNIVISIKI
jgi:hypothetical protein